MAIKTLTQNGILPGDKEYIEEYFKICELFQKKRLFFKESRSIMDRVKDEKTDVNDKDTPLKEIFNLNSLIKEKEISFWSRVENDLVEGKKFSIETMSLTYELDLFEKRVFLFFLYLEFFHALQNICYRDELLKIFDLDDSVVWRMQAFRYFTPESRLVESGIIKEESEDRTDSCTVKLRLCRRMLNIFSRTLNGEQLDLKKAIKVDVSCDDVGFIKQPEHTIDEVMLKNETKEKVLFFLDSFRDKRVEELGVFKKIKKSKGLNFLFYGTPGTGKSMLAEAVAAYLNKKLLIVDVSKIMSKWIGETDKKISRMFKVAQNNDMVLCIDEADSLLCSRSLATEDHDIRFVNEMLQEVERFDGVAVFTTNMDALLDEALERRVSLKVRFELPDEEIRCDIWRSHMPDNIKIAQDVDFMFMARKYEFSGGYIKNAVLNAMRKIALDNKNTITMQDLIFGAEIENEGIFNKQNRKQQIGFSTIR